ncbi:MAG: OsmC family protein [Anaerolineae bacterium]|nr:OsmC family protein [Anaerolineae bacterium]
MGTIRVKWLEKLQFVGIDSTKHSVVMSSPNEENGTGMKPSELMLVALGGCSAYDVVNILSKKRQVLTDLDVSVSAEQEPDPPWTFRKIHMKYRLRGKGLSEKVVRDAVELSKTKYCSVGVTLSAAAEITYDIVIEEDV